MIRSRQIHDQPVLTGPNIGPLPTNSINVHSKWVRVATATNVR
jgi:hypothetical protein